MGQQSDRSDRTFSAAQYNLSEGSHGDVWKRKERAHNHSEDDDINSIRSEYTHDECDPKDNDPEDSNPMDSDPEDSDFEDSNSIDNDIAREDMAKKAAIILSNSSHWSVRYQLWSLSGGQSIIEDLMIDLPEYDISHMLFVSLHLMEIEELRVPVSFSSDLQTVMIMRSVIRITDGICRIQSLDNVLVLDALRQIQNRPQLLQTSHLDWSNQVWYCATFSQNGRFLATIRSGAALHGHTFDSKGCFEYSGCSIAIYEDRSHNSATPKYHLFAQTDLFDEIGSVSKPLALHPSFSILATVLDEKTYAWRFTKQSSLRLLLEDVSVCASGKLVEIYDQPLNDITFSSCGRYLYGSRFVENFDPITINLQPVFTTELSTEAAQQSVVELLPISSLSPGSCGQVPSAQSPNNIVVASTSRQLQQTIVKHSNPESAVILQAVDRQGTLHTADLLRLPLSARIGSSYPTVLDPMGSSEMIHMVLNKAFQEKYSFSDCPGLVLPLVIQRRRDTVSTFVHKRSICNVDNDGDIGRKRRRFEK